MSHASNTVVSSLLNVMFHSVHVFACKITNYKFHVQQSQSDARHLLFIVVLQLIKVCIRLLTMSWCINYINRMS